jgi:hypothetical protein
MLCTCARARANHTGATWALGWATPTPLDRRGGGGGGQSAIAAREALRLHRSCRCGAAAWELNVVDRRGQGDIAIGCCCWRWRWGSGLGRPATFLLGGRGGAAITTWGATCTAWSQWRMAKHLRFCPNECYVL